MNFSKKLSTNPSQVNNLNAQIGQFVKFNQQEFAELLTFIDFAEEFTIGFIEINFPPDAELLIEELKTSPECQDIQFFTINLIDPNLRFFRDEILNILPTIDREPTKN